MFPFSLFYLLFSALRCNLHQLARSHSYYRYYRYFGRYESDVDEGSVPVGQTVKLVCVNRQDRRQDVRCTANGFQPATTDLNCEPGEIAENNLKLKPNLNAFKSTSRAKY